MTTVKAFIFNPFQENTYIVYDETRECVIIDPGCYSVEEKLEVRNFVLKEGLKPVKVLLTHGHIDHILGNNFVTDEYGIKIHMHENDVTLLQAAPSYGEMWDLHCELSPDPAGMLKEGDIVRFGKTSLEVYFTPGHSQGSICFYNREDNFVISGDVLFFESIGRTDLPGGDFDTLINSIHDKLFQLPEACKVFSGHGPTTTISHEKEHNPFLMEQSH